MSIFHLNSLIFFPALTGKILKSVIENGFEISALQMVSILVQLKFQSLDANLHTIAIISIV